MEAAELTISDVQVFADKVMDNLRLVIVGKEQALELTVIGLLCQGHILIEDVPGVGKTGPQPGPIFGRFL
jgi:MoxR-like ATPase